MAEPQAPEVVSLDEVRELLKRARNYRRDHPVPRLCATVEHYAAWAGEETSKALKAQAARDAAVEEQGQLERERDLAVQSLGELRGELEAAHRENREKLQELVEQAAEIENLRKRLRSNSGACRKLRHGARGSL